MLNRGYAHTTIISSKYHGQTLLSHLASLYPHSTPQAWQQKLNNGEVTLNGVTAGGSESVTLGQTLVWNRPPWIEPDSPQHFEVLFEDPHLLAVNKPSGLPTLPGGGFMENTLLRRVQKQTPNANPVHRLGRATTGIVLFAKTPQAASNLGNYLLDRLSQEAHNHYMEAPKTLQDAILYFADFENCKAFLSSLRWPDDVVKCPRCQSEKILWIEKERVWKCYGKHDHAKFSLKTGTVMEDSPISLDKWLTALWLIVNCKNGISSCEVARDLGITQKSAWFLNHRIRMMIHNGSVEKLSGHVEADETFIGGKARNMHVAERKRRITGTGGKDKTAVMGIVQRGGKVRTSVVPNRKKSALQAEVRKHVEAGSALYTDALLSYQGLEADYAHQVIDHAVAYVDGNVHTNTLENFWSLLKRGISGTYVSVEPFHLFRYLDEQAYRYNFRKDMNDFDRFKLAASQMVGKRLTWNEATGKNHETQTYPN